MTCFAIMWTTTWCNLLASITTPKPHRGLIFSENVGLLLNCSLLSLLTVLGVPPPLPTSCWAKRCWTAVQHTGEKVQRSETQYHLTESLAQQVTSSSLRQQGGRNAPESGSRTLLAGPAVLRLLITGSSSWTPRTDRSSLVSDPGVTRAFGAFAGVRRAACRLLVQDKVSDLFWYIVSSVDETTVIWKTHISHIMKSVECQTVLQLHTHKILRSLHFGGFFSSNVTSFWHYTYFKNLFSWKGVVKSLRQILQPTQKVLRYSKAQVSLCPRYVRL